jgi:glycogen debranching enzyme
MLQPQSKSQRLADPVATCGDRVYIISSQNGLFPDSWGGHVPGEMWGVWSHPIKLLDGFWFGISTPGAAPQWLIEADVCRVSADCTEFDYRLGSLRVTRRDFVPDGLEGAVITLAIRASEPPREPLALHALFRSDLRPAWLGDQAGMADGQDVAAARPDGCVFTDPAGAWACAIIAGIEPDDVATGDALWAAQRTGGRGASALVRATLRFDAGDTATAAFFIAGSRASEDEAIATARLLGAEHADLQSAKAARCESIVETSRVATPDAALNEAMAWSKLASQMLARTVPEYGAGAGAGLPEYPWWFGIDAEYAVLPMLQSGQFDLARDTLRLLKRWSLEHNAAQPGRVLHEMSTTGVVFNPGNLVETPAFTRAAHQVWLWTGDRAFLEEMVPFCKQGLLDHTLGSCDPDGDLCPSGRSIIETLEMHAGFETVDVAAYTWDALMRLVDMAAAVGDDAIVPAARRNADRLGELIRREWWLEGEGLFADVRASLDEVDGVLSRLAAIAAREDAPRDAREQARAAIRLFEPDRARHHGQARGADLPWLLRHWVVMCPLEVGLAEPGQAGRVLKRLLSDEFCNEWGMYLHPERHDVMSINTGLLALSAARYGQVDEALGLIGKLTRAFSYRTPGAVSEALPDQWCFLQLWSNVGLVAPVVECFLGIEPRAGERKLRVAPKLPGAWNRVEARRLRVGDAAIDIRVAREDGRCAISLAGAAGWAVDAGIVLPAGALPTAMRLNGQPCGWQTAHTRAGLRVTCPCEGDAELTVEFQQAHR